MGETADMMLEGILDEQTGEFIDDELSRQGGPGYPRTMQKGFYNSMTPKRKKFIKKVNQTQIIGGRHLLEKFADFNGNRVKIVDYKKQRRKSARYTVKILSKGKLKKTFLSRLTNISKNQ